VVAAASLLTAPPREPAIDVFFNFGDGCYRTSASTPQGARHRCLKLQWWLPPVYRQHPQGPAIDVFNFGGGRYQQHPQGACHQLLLHLHWWLLSGFGKHPQGAAIDVWVNLVPAASIFLVTPTRGHCGKHYHCKQDKTSFDEKKFRLLRC
jgi:hypothetical protein